jgi:hypothetical protein
MIRVFDSGFDDNGNPVVSIQAEGPLLASDMQTAPAGGYEVAMVSTGRTSQAVADVLVDIQTRIADGQPTPVLASHLDALGLRDAVEAWARGAE